MKHLFSLFLAVTLLFSQNAFSMSFFKTNKEVVKEEKNVADEVKTEKTKNKKSSSSKKSVKKKQVSSLKKKSKVSQKKLSKKTRTASKKSPKKTQNLVKTQDVQNIVVDIAQEVKLEPESVRLNKTQGHYVGFNLVASKMGFYERSRYSSSDAYSNYRFSYDDTNYDGFDVNYKYAVNFNDFFFAPGVFFEKTNAKARGDDTSNYYDNGSAARFLPDNLQKVTLDQRYGIKSDIGYDLSDVFSPYIAVGFARIDYSTKNYLVSNDLQSVLGTNVMKDSKNDWFYGIGLKSNISKDVSLNFEFNRHSFLAKQAFDPTNSYYDYYEGYYKVKVDIIKLGASYRF